MNDNVERVVKEAKSWEGRYFSTARYGAPGPYCAAFVRYVFRTALGEAGEMPVVMADRYRAMGHPYTGYPVGELFADSLAGDPIGPAIAANLMRPGDLLFFIDTYSGYAQGTITHIGICVGGGLMADAGSGSLVHVRNHALYFPDKLVEVRRPKCLGTVAKRTFITLEHGQVQAMLHGAKAFQQDMRILFDGMLHLSVNGKEIKRAYITVEIATADQPGYAKLYCHHNRITALKGGNPVQKLEVKASFNNGALHVWVDGQEIKPVAVKIEGV